MSENNGLVSQKRSGWAAFRRAWGQMTVRCAILLALLAFGSMHAAAQSSPYAVVAVDTNGAVSFSPGVIVAVVIGGAVAAALAGASLVVLGLGIAWVYKMIKRSKA